MPSAMFFRVILESLPLNIGAPLLPRLHDSECYYFIFKASTEFFLMKLQMSVISHDVINQNKINPLFVSGVIRNDWLT